MKKQWTSNATDGLAGDTPVRVWLRDGVVDTGLVKNYDWRQVGAPSDIVEYELFPGNQLTTLNKMDLHEKAFRPPVEISPMTVADELDLLEADGRLARPDANTDPNTETFGQLALALGIANYNNIVGNGDANGEGKQTNPKDLIGSRKAKFSVIPAGVLFDLGNAMTEGMCKYGRHNYRHAGIRASVYYDAACGHLADWWEGQDIDPESGLSHVTKAIASLVVLRDAMLQDMMTDDRPPRSKVFKADFSPMTAEIIDRHKDKNPRHFTIADSKVAA